MGVHAPMPRDAGILYVVATPIGNLEDLTFRALRILKEVDLIAAEDTRRTAKLLAHYQISKPMVSLREHNELRESPRLIDKLTTGQNVALVSDAGTPAIADPGARLVRAARTAGIKVIAIPGPSAVTAALSVSGLPETEFVFKGFPPATGARRREWLEDVVREPKAVVFFEAPHRILRTLEEAQQQLDGRPIHVYREISKIHEEYVIRQNNSSSVNLAAVAGEFTCVIEPAPVGSAAPDAREASDLFYRLTKSTSFSEEEALSLVAAALRSDERAVRKMIKKHKILVKRETERLA
jgi:16S rRNA (cytidine1402-2'-O)-methyltransferase